MTDPGHEPVALVAVVGSLRAASASRAVYRAAGALVADLGATLDDIPLAEVPLFNQDVEDQGYPEPVTAMRDMVDGADGLLFFTPEYNNSIPAVTKNALDWLSRRRGDSPISRTAVGVVATTPGRHGARGVQAHLEDSLRSVTPTLYEPSLGIASINRRMTDGTVDDPELIEELRAWLQAFIDFAAEHRTRG